MITGDLRKWLSFGTGIGVEIRGDDLVVTAVRVRPSEVRILGGAVVAGFRRRPAADWGAEYQQFLRRHGCAHLSAAVLLPREQIIVRQLSLPGVSDKDLESAVGYQVDSLHPYPEDDVVFTWARVPGTSVVLVAIALREAIEHYAASFAEAGLRAAAFTFSAAACYAAFRMLRTPPAGGFLVLEPHGEGWEAYGESPSRPLFSATFDLPRERAVALAAAELRLPPDTQPFRLVELLPEPVAAPEGWNLSDAVASYATALAGACPWLALSANLLAPEHRRRSSRAVYIPTVVLASILLVLLGALGVVSGMAERDYQAALQQEINRYTAQAARVRGLEAEIQRLQARRELLRRFYAQTRDDLDVLRDLTNLLAPPAWLRNLQIARSEVRFSGEAAEAGKLLEIIDSSPRLRNSEYTAPISASGELERFSIRALREQAATEKAK